MTPAAITASSRLWADPTVVLDGLTISNGFKPGGSGGGIYNNGGTLTVSNSTLSGNSADGDGGGIYNERAR